MDAIWLARNRFRMHAGIHGTSEALNAMDPMDPPLNPEPLSRKPRRVDLCLAHLGCVCFLALCA